MPGYSIFYSWQTDLPNKTNRDFIRKAADTAVERLSIGLSVEDAPRLEEAAVGVAGLPVIGETILRRIDGCGLFLADVSIVAETLREDKQKKRSPNPNVMLELGYAAARISWNRIIVVMNMKYGTQDMLPFDLRNRRWPRGYTIADDRSDLDSQCEKLSSYIEEQIRWAEQEEHQSVTDILKKLNSHVRMFIRNNAHATHFWESEITGNQILGTQHFAIDRLLELGLIECVSFVNTQENAYTWTYLGSLCIARLGILGPPLQPTTFIPQSEQPQVYVDMSAYDSFFNSIQNQPD